MLIMIHIKEEKKSHSHILLFIGVMESIIKTIISLDKKQT